MSQINTCGGCDNTWTGLKPAHCTAAGCHTTFSGPAMFDSHRKHGKCITLADVHLIEGVLRSTIEHPQYAAPADGELTQAQQIRAWGVARDMARPSRGRLSAEVIAAWEAETGETYVRPEAAEKPAKAPKVVKVAQPTVAGKMRAWAIENGHEIGSRGRIHATIVEAFQAAHAS